MIWNQTYDPLSNSALSTLFASVPLVLLLGAIASKKVTAHIAALMALVAAFVIAVAINKMPLESAVAATTYGACYGLFPIGWIVLNLIFLYRLTEKSGLFTLLQNDLSKIAPDRRIQLLLIAFSLGAFFEGAAGFGTPVAITAALLIRLGFSKLEASGLSLIANTAPVAFGALGTPIIALSNVTGLDLMELSKTTGRIVPIFSMIVPLWLVCAYCGIRRALQVWPVVFVAGAGFAVPQFLVANFHGPWLVDIVASVSSIICVLLLLRVWKPREIDGNSESNAPAAAGWSFRAWMPWLLLSVFVFIWGIPSVRSFMDGSKPAIVYGNRISVAQNTTSIKINVPGLDGRVRRTPPVAPEGAPPERVVFSVNWLSATGTAILIAAFLSGLGVMNLNARHLCLTYFETLRITKLSLITIALMLALGNLTKFSGSDATLGLAMAKTGLLYPFFGTLLGWLGVALTGSDTASNVLFGGLQRITSEQLGISPVLMGSANTVGGVMGKMIDAQSIVVASTATNWTGSEGTILRYVFVHSLVLASLVGLVITACAYSEVLERLVTR